MTSKGWTAIGGSVGVLGAVVLLGQLLFGAGAKTKTFTTQEQIEKVVKELRVDQRTLRGRIRALEIQGGVRSVQIQGINKKLDGLDGKLDKLLYFFQTQIRPGNRLRRRIP